MLSTGFSVTMACHAWTARFVVPLGFAMLSLFY
jgi:hypothetical protein